MKQDKEKQVRDKLLETTKTVRAYATSDCSKAVIEMLDALGQSYTMDLVHCQVEELIQIQSSLRQIYAIRNVLANEGLDIPKI